MGIQSQVIDSASGRQRILINGLRGEYTTVLIDGVPIQSFISSVYGLDLLPTAALERVDVTRGTGPSLLSPEAIGGTVNLVTHAAKETRVGYDFSIGNQDYRALSILGTGVDPTGKRRVVLAGQFHQQGYWDADHNQVTESPSHRNFSMLAKVTNDFTERDHFDVRGVYLQGVRNAGPTNDSVFGSLSNTGTATGFEDGNVSKRYTGPKSLILESIAITRFEITERWTHEFSNDFNLQLTGSAAGQNQDSVYQGHDYSNKDKINYLDLKFNRAVGAAHLLTAGTYFRGEHLRSESYRLFTALGIPKDDLDLIAMGLYAQDIWKLTEALELSSAIRGDYLMLNWRGRTAQDYEIAKWVASPRILLKWTHLPVLVSRFSVGQGYRAPVTFLAAEPDLVLSNRLNNVEQADSAAYSLALEQETVFGSASANWTRIRRMAYVNRKDFGQPTWVNDGGNHFVQSLDGLLGYHLTQEFSVSGGYEKFFYDDRYKKALPAAAIEDRARLIADYEGGGWGITTTAITVGSRDLRSYGYTDRYSRWDGKFATEPKRLNAPTYTTLDFRLTKAAGIHRNLKIYMGIKNLLNTLQVAKESPLYYDAQGNLKTAHVWGPLRGREYYVGIQGQF